MMENDIKRINTITIEGESMDGKKLVVNYKILSLYEWSQEFEFGDTLPIVNLRFGALDATVYSHAYCGHYHCDKIINIKQRIIYDDVIMIAIDKEELL